jgi:acyl-CoA thioesterase I
MKKPLAVLLCAMVLILLVVVSGCVTGQKKAIEQQLGESVVFIGDEQARLAYRPLQSRPIEIRNTYQRFSNSVDYVEGRDYVIDYSSSTLRRTPDSRLPDFSKNILFGKNDFDHSKFPGFGNGGFFAFVDYSFTATEPWPIQAPQTRYLESTKGKLREGKSVKIVAFGDSITAGGDATKPQLIFWQRWADALQRKYPRARVTAINGATGGDSTVQGLQRLQAKVLAEKPDLVLIGFGMNDHNVGGVPIPQFEQNLKEMIRRIRSETPAEVVLFSAFSPNPRWKFGSHRMSEYATATDRVAREVSCAYADVFNNWERIAARKKPEDLLGNNINHPNDFGHWIYFRVLQDLGL